MKKSLSPLLVLLAFFMASCHNYSRETTENQEKLSADSARRADSISTANKNDSSDRVVFLKSIELKIDSMQSQIASLDSVYNTKSEKERAKWNTRRGHINARINRLKEREKEAATTAKEKWSIFKAEVDTAIQNIKYEWKNGE